MSPRLREYVRASELARVIEEWLDGGEERSINGLARRVGVSKRAITKILHRERPYVSVYLADRVMVAIDRHICELAVLMRAASENKRQPERRRLEAVR